MLAACGYPDASLAPPAEGAARPTAEKAGPAPEAGDFGFGTPLMVIRFGAEPVDYENALARAVAEARARRPDAKFRLLAVSANGGAQFAAESSLKQAEAVLRSLAALGVPPEDVTVAAAAGPPGSADEVRLYPR